MSRRDGDHDTARDDAKMVGVDPFLMQEGRYLRLRCLELAVKLFDPEAEILPHEACSAAEDLFKYVTTGEWAAPFMTSNEVHHVDDPFEPPGPAEGPDVPNVGGAGSGQD